MAHFVQYHNPDKMNGPFRPANTDFAIVTDKRGGLREGDTVWLMTGERRPRQFSLCQTFVVEKIIQQNIRGFKYRMSGSDGKSFDPPIKIPKTGWFLELLKITGNFRFGLQHIKSQSIVGAMQRISTSA